jgi:cytochrome b
LGGVIANLTFLRHEENPHIYVGCIVVAALIIRFGWGFVARGHTRASHFVQGPRELIVYSSATFH